MRYSASEKAEIIRLVGQSALPIKRTLEKLNVPRATFYRWYDLYQSGGPEALDDRSPRPDRVWNRIPDDIRERIVQLALDEPALSPRELAVRFTDTEKYFVSEASVYRLLKAHDLIASPAFIVMMAADEFKDKTTAPNQLWQTDFTYLKVIGWGWFYLSTILDDFSRYIIAWKLCTTMKVEDVTARGLHIIIDATCAGAFKKGEGPLVGVEHHLLRLAGIGADKHHAAVAETDVRDLHDRRHAVHHDDLVAPIELVSFARRKRQRHVGVRHLARMLPAPGPGIAANSVIAALISQCPQLLEEPDQSQTFACRIAGVRRKHPVKLSFPTT